MRPTQIRLGPGHTRRNTLGNVRGDASFFLSLPARGERSTEATARSGEGGPSANLKTLLCRPLTRLSALRFATLSPPAGRGRKSGNYFDLRAACQPVTASGTASVEAK